MAAPGNDELYELTRSQLSIWTGQRLQPGEPLYNMILSFEIRGPVDPGLFQQAFQKLVDDSDALRIVIDSEDEVPRQRFRFPFSYRVEVVDFSTEREPRQALETWIDERRQRDFDLGECLFESTLLKLDSACYVWYFNQHHLSTDASTTALLFQRMQEYYARASGGRLDQADGVPAYRDYVLQERAARDSASFARAQAFWQDRLSTPLQPSRFYRQPPAERSGQTERRTCQLGVDRSFRLRALAKQDAFRAFTQDLARFQVFATALFAYLSRITGNLQLAIGTPTHNRVSPALKATPGLFIEVYPVQVQVERDDSFLSLHTKVAHATQQFLINTAPGVSGFDHNRAYDVVLNYITAAFGDFAGMAVQSEWIHAGHGDRNHLLRLQVHDFDRSDQFVLHFDMNIDAFVGDERERAMQHFLLLLDAFLDEPGRRIAAVPLLTEEESNWLTAAQNETRKDAAVSRTVVEMFRAQVVARPEATALVCGDDVVTYAVLGDRIDRLAHDLMQRGVGRGGRVALCLPRSIDVVVAVFAVLECGAVYLPIDPDLPADRIAFMLEDAQVSCVLTTDSMHAHLPADSSIVVRLDKIAEQALAKPYLASQSPSRLNDACYLIYTSGSTGRPKGVIVNHAGLANYIDWAGRYYLDGEALDFALFSNLAFDLTVTSLFLPLVTGNKLFIYPEATDRREITIQRVVEDNQVGIVKLTPAHLALIQSLDLSGSRIRKLIVGGEDLKTDLVQAVRRRFGGKVEIYNEYGPTEGTVACMIHRFDPERDTERSVPIGRPIDNLQIYLLDAERRPVPPGVVGQIFIGGAGVTDGYLNAPGLTAQKFIVDPVDGAGRVYASGDLGRWGSDGVMRFLGRGDDQVKIRGVRVELAEIESALIAHPQISECTVTVVDRSPSAPDADEEKYCRICGISARHPDAKLDDEQVCRICRAYEQEPDKAHGYFGNMEGLQQIVEEARAEQTGKYDSLALLSGGKDSTYALCKLVEMGLRPLVFTLDNGYISDGAKANIRRLTDSLGLDLHVATTPAMNAIFVDSLNRHSNVCNGCFKTIYTLSMNLAREHGIRYITTGLSRGQIFETRLADLFRHRIFDPDEIDRLIIQARKAYHRLDDVISRELDTEIFDDDRVFEEIRFVDFYRYCDIGLDDIYAYLDTQAGWVRPADTGRSTNCLINEAGIYVHKTERGYHNYALPYSWDVRLGHKQRDAAREELNDNINVVNVKRTLAEIGYEGEAVAPIIVRDKRLIAYYVSPVDIPASDLQQMLSRSLPQELVPVRYVRLDALPLTRNGKVDRDALPDRVRAPAMSADDYAAPNGNVERQLAELWAEVIGLDRVGRDDNFFDLGGDSILNIQIVSHAKRFGLAITPQQIFDHPTIASLAAAVGRIETVESEQGVVEGDAALTPIQRRFFELERPQPQHYNQAVLLELPATCSREHIESALQQLLIHHDGLRSRFRKHEGEWRQTLLGIRGVDSMWPLVFVEPSDADGANLARHLDAVERDLHDRLDLEDGPLMRGAYLACGDGRPDLLFLLVHHLLIDGVSWWILLEDLHTACNQLADGQPVRLPAKTTSIPQWARALSEYANAGDVRGELDFWVGSSSVVGELPRDLSDAGSNDLASERVVSRTLASTETAQLLQQVPKAYNTQVADVLLTALTQVLAAWSGQAEVFLDIEGHGREEGLAHADLLRTAGWLTSIYPVRLRCEAGLEPAKALMSTKAQLRAVPRRGIGYGALRYLSDEPAVRDRLAQAPEREVLFNYLGQWNQASASASGMQLARPITISHGREGSRRYLLEINAVVFSGQLRVDWSYSANAHLASTVDSLADAFVERLKLLIGYCLSAGAQGLTPSDFPHADLDQDGLDELLAEFDEE
jgi:amino acid adenylation domain-containing protein/non-ribosomal peptide synthase protein (TIGR01720 family)